MASATLVHSSVFKRSHTPRTTKCSSCCEQFHCFLCTKTYNTKEGVSHHLEVHKKNALKVNDLYVNCCHLACDLEMAPGPHFHCPFCGVKYRRKDTMRKHLPTCHSEMDFGAENIVDELRQEVIKPPEPPPHVEAATPVEAGTAGAEETAEENWWPYLFLMLLYKADNLSNAQSGSSLSLASATTNEADSVNSGGGGSQRCDSVESFPGSRNSSCSAERDWDNGSTASSITSMAEYTGPKLFKEPSAKSNKPIIHNAIAHCCLAGKVNEPQKNQILEELEKCESNHLMILFRDGGCQFRALYSFFPDTKEITKLTGTGPKSISRKMIDKFYKYSSGRKQFTVFHAKTVSVSVDALTIHKHLWQTKKGTVPKSLKSVK